MTNFFELLFRVGKADQAGELEEGQGMNLARAASKTSTLQHYVWHTLQPAAKMTGGKYPVPECDYKARVEERIRSELPDLAIITSFLMMSYYPSNMAGFPLCKPFELVGDEHNSGLGPTNGIFAAHVWREIRLASTMPANLGGSNCRRC